MGLPTERKTVDGYLPAVCLVSAYCLISFGSIVFLLSIFRLSLPPVYTRHHQYIRGFFLSQGHFEVPRNRDIHKVNHVNSQIDNYFLIF